MRTTHIVIGGVAIVFLAVAAIAAEDTRTRLHSVAPPPPTPQQLEEMRHTPEAEANQHRLQRVATPASLVSSTSHPPIFSEPQNSQAKAVWDECVKLATAGEAYSYFEGELTAKDIFLPPGDCFENCKQKSGQLSLSFSYSENRKQHVRIGGRNEDELTQLADALHVGSKYALCMVADERLLKQGVTRYSTKTLYHIED